MGRATLLSLTQAHAFNDFNPRPPWGGRPIRYGIQTVINKFQSTPSVGRATQRLNRRHRPMSISIHALRGEGDDILGCGMPYFFISIHALRGEGDPQVFYFVVAQNYFNPRPPWGGRLPVTQCPSSCAKHFNPRPPWGGRLK